MIPDSHQAPLLAAAQSVINAVCNQRMGQMQRAPSSEVDFIASIIENGVGLLESAFRRARRYARDMGHDAPPTVCTPRE